MSKQTDSSTRRPTERKRTRAAKDETARRRMVRAEKYGARR